MGFDRRRLTFLALCQLDEAFEQATLGKVTPSVGLRLALAFLYAVGDRRKEWFEHEPYLEFWQAATQDDRCGGSAAAFGRSQILNASFNAIARAAGIERDVELMRRMSDARKRAV
ncbi:hypothetical protein BH10PSE14_BH10PSE14_27470 [soil metagenome]